MHTRILIVAALWLTAGCHIGTPPRRFAAATGPQGALVAVRVTGETQDRVGELYAADAQGLILYTGQLLQIGWSRVHALDVDRLGSRYDIIGRSPDSEHVARLAAVSRFPQGLRGDLLRRVLEILRQDSLRVAAGLTLDSLASSAARASQRFEDRRTAMAAGYRRVGADFPGMGEHWVNPVSLLNGRVDPTLPSFLTYATIAGTPRLLGVGFIATSERTSGPPAVPGFSDHWHEHSGLLDEESGARVGSAQSEDSAGSRVWVLHIWTRLPNPDGRFAADNWSLPFARAGLTPPASADADAARAFTLTGARAGDGDEFLRAVLSDAGLRTAANALATDSVIARASLRASQIADALTPGAIVSDSILMQLRSVWAEMTQSLERAMGPAVATLLMPPHPVDGAHRHAHR